MGRFSKDKFIAPATERQLEYIEKLQGYYPAGLTKKAASDLIQEITEERDREYCGDLRWEK